MRRDSYLEYLHAGVKQDTLTALCTAPVLIKTEEEVARSEERRSSSQSQRKLVVSIHMLPMTNLIWTRSCLSQLGSKYLNASRERKVVASLQLSHRNRPRVQNLINDNYCVKCATGLKDCVCVPGQRVLNPSPGIAKDRDLTSKRAIL